MTPQTEKDKFLSLILENKRTFIRSVIPIAGIRRMEKNLQRICTELGDSSHIKFREENLLLWFYALRTNLNHSFSVNQRIVIFFIPPSESPTR